jgi:hypothetical protein
LDIYHEILIRIDREQIRPIKTAYDARGEIDICRTQIRTSDLVDLLKERGEKPRYLRPLLVELPVPVEMPVATQAAASTTPITAPINRAQFDAEYNQRIENFRREEERYPTRQEDTEWGKSKKLKRDIVRELRKNHIPTEFRKGGRPKNEKLGKK